MNHRSRIKATRSGRDAAKSVSAILTRCAATACLAMLIPACSWWRYDDVLEKSPVEIIAAPSESGGLGKNLAVVRKKGTARVLVEANDELVAYEFDTEDLKSKDAVTQIGCRSSQSCWFGRSMATIPRLSEDSSEPVQCAAFGLSIPANESTGIALWCADGKARSLPLPESAPPELTRLQPNAANPGLVFASGPRTEPTLLAAASVKSGTIWLYQVTTDQPLLVPKPSAAGPTYATAMAVATSTDSRILAVAEPDAATVYVHLLDPTGATTLTLCLRGDAGSANALAAGPFTAEGSLDLAVLGSNELVVIPAVDAWGMMDPNQGCLNFADLTDVRRLPCRALNAGNACNELMTGATLATANLDGTGPDELLIGTPAAGARGNDAAGKVLLASFAKTKPLVIGELLASSAESGDRLGASIVGVPLSGRDVVLAGAPGGNKLAAFFCTGLVSEGKDGARCD